MRTPVPQHSCIYVNKHLVAVGNKVSAIRSSTNRHEIPDPDASKHTDLFLKMETGLGVVSVQSQRVLPKTLGQTTKS